MKKTNNQKSYNKNKQSNNIDMDKQKSIGYQIEVTTRLLNAQ